MSSSTNTDFSTDLDAFLNFDQNEQTPMSSASESKPIPNLLHPSSLSDFTPTTQFSGPSYQYDSHRQQTGLPMGGYANTLAVNQATGLHYRPGNHGFVMPTQTLNIPLTNLDDFDFNQPQSFDNFDMDVESDSPADLPSMFYDGQSSISTANQIPPRIYPGMHTQQANQAKIKQAAQKQQDVIRQQQKQFPTGQKPLPTTTPKSPAVKDPLVEESISRLLNRMRQTSTASAADDGDSPDGGMSNMARIKKDEDDMDEDERLLNSEEGKKLSSKERRQLRNKVSARAFRSRRKEYITQLESELAGKAQEANELRVQNRQLMEENTRLTDLTRMLLSSQAFSGFLQELSQTGSVQNNAQANSQQQVQPQSQSQPQPQPQPQPQASRKDIATHEAARQMNSQSHQSHHMQVGMTLIPETPINASVFDNRNAWNTVVPSNDFRVFAVTEMPKPPKFDMSTLSGKGELSEFKPSKSVTKDMPTISSLPQEAASTSKDNVVITYSSDDLYADTVSNLTTISLPTPLYTTISKAAVSSAILAAGNSTLGSWVELQQMCEQLDDTCERITRLMC